jgi:uncharacterized DUF497 family protein
MRIQWDATKRDEVFEQRSIDFTKLDELLCLPYLEDQRRDDPEQYRVIGFADGRLVTFSSPPLSRNRPSRGPVPL